MCNDILLVQISKLLEHQNTATRCDITVLKVYVKKYKNGMRYTSLDGRNGFERCM